jgi:hypothetical protein
LTCTLSDAPEFWTVAANGISSSVIKYNLTCEFWVNDFVVQQDWESSSMSIRPTWYNVSLLFGSFQEKLEGVFLSIQSTKIV